MQLNEEKRDLFSVNNEKDMWYVQCISADFACGKGIALEFNKRGDVKNLLMKNYKKNMWNGYGYCLPTCSLPETNEDREYFKVFNLVTKAKYYMKPSERTIRTALMSLHDMVKAYGIKKMAMPQIGCGLDRMDWNNVREIIQHIFQDIQDLEILVCRKQKSCDNVATFFFSPVFSYIIMMYR